MVGDLISGTMTTAGGGDGNSDDSISESVTRRPVNSYPSGVGVSTRGQLVPLSSGRWRCEQEAELATDCEPGDDKHLIRRRCLAPPVGAVLSRPPRWLTLVGELGIDRTFRTSLYLRSSWRVSDELLFIRNT